MEEILFYDSEKTIKGAFFCLEWKLNKYFRCLEDLEDAVNFLSGPCFVLRQTWVLSTKPLCGGLTLRLVQNANIALSSVIRDILTHAAPQKSSWNLLKIFSIAALLNFFHNTNCTEQNKMKKKRDSWFISKEKAAKSSKGKVEKEMMNL